MGRLIVFSGAGLSAESGLHTFRGDDGLWEGEDLDIVCNYWTWNKHYAKVHEFYNARRASMNAALPNDAHRAIAEWQTLYDTVILTQNIDNLLEQAGCTNVVHLHGFVDGMRCIACGHEWKVSAGYQWDPKVDVCQSPKCNCRKAIKPNVIFFNEETPNYRTLNNTIRDLTADDVFVVIGTSSKVIKIGSMISDRPCFKILNNLHENPEDYSEQSVFNAKYFEPATTAVSKVSEHLKSILGVD